MWERPTFGELLRCGSATSSGAHPILAGSLAIPTSRMLHCARGDYAVREGAIDYPNPESPGNRGKVRRDQDVHAPTALRMFMRFGESYPAAHDLTSLRVIACAGEPLNPEAGAGRKPTLRRWQVGLRHRQLWQTELGARARHSASMAMRRKSGRSRTRS